MDAAFIYFKKTDSGASVEGVYSLVSGAESSCLGSSVPRCADSMCPCVYGGQWAYHVCGDPASLITVVFAIYSKTMVQESITLRVGVSLFKG